MYNEFLISFLLQEPLGWSRCNLKEKPATAAPRAAVLASEMPCITSLV